MRRGDVPTLQHRFDVAMAYIHEMAQDLCPQVAVSAMPGALGSWWIVHELAT